MARRQYQEDPLTEDSTPVRVRVLQACRFGEANDVAEVDSAELEAAKEQGLVDDNEDAVAYAEALPQNAVEE